MDGPSVWWGTGVRKENSHKNAHSTQPSILVPSVVVSAAFEGSYFLCVELGLGPSAVFHPWDVHQGGGWAALSLDLTRRTRRWTSGSRSARRVWCPRPCRHSSNATMSKQSKVDCKPRGPLCVENNQQGKSTNTQGSRKGVQPTFCLSF